MNQARLSFRISVGTIAAAFALSELVCGASEPREASAPGLPLGGANLDTSVDDPSMSSRTVVLGGRADERGTEGYNEALGEARAKRIKQLLIEYGVAESRITAETKGETGAVGAKPEYSHGYDRRVDVVVRGGEHAPGDK